MMLPPMEKTLTLIDSASLAQNLGDPNTRVLDATAFLDLHPDKKSGYVPRSGRPEWEAEHIRGAQHIDLVGTFSAPHKWLPFMMPTPESFCALMRGVGISQNSFVAIYSTGATMWATRLWWMFRSVGFENCVVLDGGLDKWKADDFPTVKEVTSYPAGDLTPKPSTLGFATKSEVADYLKSGKDVCLIDALTARDYSGESSKYGGKGHIPGAFNVSYHWLLNPEEGTFLSVDELKQKFAASKALEAKKVICYCGGGIASTMVAMALYRCGHRNVAVFDGSMLEWAADKSLPLKTGDQP